jgi:hypothetical protein
MDAQELLERLRAALHKPDRIDAEWLALVVVLALAGVVGVIAWSLLVGGLLTLLLPFRLFEAALLVIIASAVVAGAVLALLRGDTPAAPRPEPMPHILEADDADLIPEFRFYKSAADMTWETWFRYEVANALYAELRETPDPAIDMLVYGEALDVLAGTVLNMTRPVSDAGWQEASIRLADAATASIRANPPSGKRLRISGADLRAQMVRRSLPPYDDDLLAHAASVVSRQLGTPEVANLIRLELWDKPTSVFG